MDNIFSKHHTLIFLVLIQCHRKGPVYGPLVLSGKKRKKSNFPRNEMEELLLENSKWAVKGPSLH